MKKSKEDLVQNLKLAIFAQIINIIFSFVVSLVLPKILGVEQYSYWQLFIFYITYAGLLHFGLSDGIYLRYGGEKFEKLNSSIIGTQMKVMTFVQSIILLFTIVIVNTRNFLEPSRKKVVILFFAYAVIANATWYLGYVFQACNLTRIFSISVIIFNMSFIVSLILLIAFKQKSFVIFCVFYILSMLCSLFYIAIRGNKFIFSKMCPLKTALIEINKNIRIGINLTIANIAGSLILGVGRIVVDRTLGIESFGLMSLALSLTNFFLQFVLQISMVLFPALRRLEDREIKNTFVQLQNNVGYILTIIMVMYTPIKMILQIWLPSYKQSFYYMIFLLPICLFDGKMQLIYSTFLKVIRKERVLFNINIIALIISFILCSMSAICVNNTACVALSMMMAIFLRYFMAYVYLNRNLAVSFDTNFFYEIIFTVLFIVSNIMFKDFISFILILCLYVVYIIINRKNLAKIVTSIKNEL